MVSLQFDRVTVTVRVERPLRPKRPRLYIVQIVIAVRLLPSVPVYVSYLPDKPCRCRAPSVHPGVGPFLPGFMYVRGVRLAHLCVLPVLTEPATSANCLGSSMFLHTTSF